ncbi:hypothetical protein L0152_26900 [bacterium]|nr:hypothetical protein [bacterium]
MKQANASQENCNDGKIIIWSNPEIRAHRTGEGIIARRQGCEDLPVVANAGETNLPLSREKISIQGKSQNDS